MENHLKHGNEFANGNQDEKLADKIVIRILCFLLGVIAGAVLYNLNL
jgi:hypothetical protein